MSDKGCFGKIPGYFISREQVPKICGDNRCLSINACFQESFNNQTGLTGVTVSYKTQGFNKYRAVPK